MLTDAQLNVFKVFCRDLLKERTLSDVVRESGSRSMRLVQATLERCVNEKTLRTRKIGNMTLYKVNLTSPRAQSYLQLAAPLTLSRIENVCLQELRKNLDERVRFYSMILFGSRAARTHKDKSDLDVFILVDDYEKRKTVERIANPINTPTAIELHVVAMTVDDFIASVKADERSVVTEILAKHLAYHNVAPFCSLLSREVGRGLPAPA